jgi:phosphatidylglycerophosphatase A
MTLARWVASGAGTGLAPFAPGTVASLVAVILGFFLLHLSYALPVAALAATFGGLWAVTLLRPGGDPGWIVIDEFAGQWISMLALPHPNALGLLAAFGLFRVLDISKPGPVGWADRQKSPAGIMGDDVIAGVMAACILWAVRMRWPELLDFSVG